ncbi:MAG: Uncharacterized protein G01um101413_856 [Parcubacteria group bacterium Gr01-1014_13]|nr:MAG: Uncharacterized protein G01um101413_856 [Parcubacteria group bacterium Gr01-1014_13]
MQNSQLNRVINLVKRTGEKTVIMDNESDAVMMLMDLGAYEKMLDHTPARESSVEKLTEEELLEKINRDVAIWRASNDRERVEVYDEVVEKSPKFEKAMMVEKSVETVPITVNKYPNVQVEQEHSASDIVAEEDEEKFYLEPVE